MNPNGVTIKPSKYTVKETMNRLVVFLQQNGATIYVRINQQMELNQAGQDSGPLEFLMFSNPGSNNPMAIENPVVALDFPLRIIAWEDDERKYWVAYNNAAYFRERYGSAVDEAGPSTLDNLISQALKITT